VAVGARHRNLWRTTGDINDTYERMSLIGFGQNGLEKFAGPGHWNDPDMLGGRQRRNETRRISHAHGAMGAPCSSFARGK